MSPYELMAQHAGYSERRHLREFASPPASESYSSRRHAREFDAPMTMRPLVVGLARGMIEAFDLVERGFVHEGLGVRPGEPLHYDLVLAPEEAETGGAFRLSLPARRPCGACTAFDRRFCPECEGEGFVVDEREIEVRVPARVRDGASGSFLLQSIGVDGVVVVTVRVA